MDAAAHAGTDTAATPLEAAFDHGAISRFNAWFFTAFAGYINHIAATHKERAFSGLAGGTVLEIGAGTGANLARIPPGARLLAVEPSLRMHERLRARAEAAGVDITVVPTGAESIPLPDASVDEVISSLVLCTVRDPERAVAEVRRVLRPGGRFRFVEHVAERPRHPRSGVQRAIRKPWGWVFEGCDPHRNTPHVVEQAGFGSVQITRRRFRHSLFWPVNSAVWGIAVR